MKPPPQRTNQRPNHSTTKATAATLIDTVLSLPRAALILPPYPPDRKKSGTLEPEAAPDPSPTPNASAALTLADGTGLGSVCDRPGVKGADGSGTPAPASAPAPAAVAAAPVAPAVCGERGGRGAPPADILPPTAAPAAVTELPDGPTPGEERDMLGELGITPPPPAAPAPDMRGEVMLLLPAAW